MGEHDSFPGALDLRSTRRSFLKLAGFTFGGAAMTGCSRGVDNRAIPFLVKPEEVVPGRANWYATLCGGCPAGCGVLAKSRDGRPIKLEGNPGHPLTGGGLCAVGQAQVLSLYDSQRLRGPRAGGKPATWEQVDAEITRQLAAIRHDGGAVRFLTGTVHGPTERAALARFLSSFRDGRHVMVDTPSAAAILDAQTGARVLPRYRFDRADLIVSFDADFLGTWISPVEYTRGWSEGRRPGVRFSRHVQFESRLSLTGSKADRRVALAPDAMTVTIARLAELVAKRAGRSAPWPPVAAASVALEELAGELWAAPRGRSLVVCGTNDRAAQRIAAWLNRLLGNDGPEGTVDRSTPSHQRLGDDAAFRVLQREVASGRVAALLVSGCNPAHELPGALDLAQVPLVVSFAEREDETAEQAGFLCPDHHMLESWSDAEPVAGIITVGQPLVAPLAGTRSRIESLEVWTGGTRGAREILRETWERDVWPRRRGGGDFSAFFDRAVHDGFAEVEPGAVRAGTPGDASLDAPVPAPPDGEGLLLVLHASHSMLDGRHAHNPWLHELPDPISKVVWDNHASLSPATARRLGVETGDRVRITAGDGPAVELPAVVQPGQHDRAVAIALGYGRKGTDRFALVGPEWIEGAPTVEPGRPIGANAAALQSPDAPSPVRVTVTPVGRRHPLARTQQYDSLTEPDHLGGRHRDHARSMTLAERMQPADGEHAAHASHGDLWPADHRYEGHHWAMVVDLTACTGCSACLIACQAENNVPVVGRDEVARQREMHWLRIDRYYATDGDATDVVHQPMLCHHCDHAPCETVCPVLATVHGSEGLNQQVYNRCVGTRYCANNCPYKVRRFNWFDYPREDQLQNMVLNPDVTVRMRGVMEKCSFCVQRIQEAKAEAKRKGVPLADGAIQPACAQSCPARAIVFGDRNDPESAVAALRADPHHYHVLDELDLRPAVGYLPGVRNRPGRPEESHG